MIKKSAMIFEGLFSRQWWKTTLFVIAAVAVMIRLGFWQLDRLEQRRAFNARAEVQLSESPLDLSGQNIDRNLYDMEYRTALVNGEYDHSRQVVLRNQDWQGRLGVHILTPLLIAGEDQAILIDRGWVPYEDYTEDNLNQYDDPGTVEIEGIIRRSQVKSAIGGRPDQVPGPGEAPLDVWNWINITDISGQIPYQLLPVYLVSVPGAGQQNLPYRIQTELDLSEGSHLGYAFQWFIFAAIMAIGYPFYVRREDQRVNNDAGKKIPYIQPDPTTDSHTES